MRPTGHLNSTTIALGIFNYFNSNLDIILSFVFLLGAIIIDFDYFLKKIFIETNHRRYFTHYLPFWISLSIIIIQLQIYVFLYFILGICFHILFDWFDWGLPMIPHKRNSSLTPHLLKIPNLNLNKNELLFYRIYWNSKAIIIIEMLLLIGSLISIQTIPHELAFVIIGLAILAYGEVLALYLLGKNTSFSSS